MIADDCFNPAKMDICITSYEICVAESRRLNRINWQFLILDEAHRLKDVNSRLSQSLRTFKAVNRLLITGTPLHVHKQSSVY
jgi:SWI/SNF-related matrix-associated actin-dependent regulator of chromatin subfamily A member 5